MQAWRPQGYAIGLETGTGRGLSGNIVKYQKLCNLAIIYLYIYQFLGFVYCSMVM